MICSGTDKRYSRVCSQSPSLKVNFFVVGYQHLSELIEERNSKVDSSSSIQRRHNSSEWRSFNSQGVLLVHIVCSVWRFFSQVFFYRIELLTLWSLLLLYRGLWPGVIVDYLQVELYQVLRGLNLLNSCCGLVTCFLTNK